MKFWVVTPSYNQKDFLMRCVASVRDQANSLVSVHHHVQDGGSGDGTVEWARQHEQSCSSESGGSRYSFSFVSAADTGMYDAINKGWLAASADVDAIAHLNCDEQYLPGALARIGNYLHIHPRVDVALADMIVIDGAGGYICHRRSIMPRRSLSRLCCVGMTTTTFQRIRVLREFGVKFDPSWTNIGDMVWYNDLHRAGVRFGVCNSLVAAFADTGENLNLAQSALDERERYAREYLRGMRLPTRLCSKYYSLRRYLKDIFIASPTEFSIYWDSTEQREIRPIAKPTPLWHRSR